MAGKHGAGQYVWQPVARRRGARPLWGLPALRFARFARKNAGWPPVDPLSIRPGGQPVSRSGHRLFAEAVTSSGESALLRGRRLAAHESRGGAR